MSKKNSKEKITLFELNILTMTHSDGTVKYMVTVCNLSLKTKSYYFLRVEHHMTPAEIVKDIQELFKEKGKGKARIARVLLDNEPLSLTSEKATQNVVTNTISASSVLGII